MTPAALTGYVMVPLFGAVMCTAPAVTRPIGQLFVTGLGTGLMVLIYRSRPDIDAADPAIMVTARIGVGWTLNLGNPAAWLIIAVIIATAAGLAVIRIAAGM